MRNIFEDLEKIHLKRIKAEENVRSV